MSGVEKLSSSYGEPAFVRESTVQSVASLDETRQRASMSIRALGASTLMADLPSIDPLANVLAKHLPTHLRPRDRDLSGSWPAPLAAQVGVKADDPFLDTGRVSEEEVQQVTRANAWRKIATLARSHIKAHGEATDQHHHSARDGTAQPELENVLQWWTVRCYALVRLRLFAMLGHELNAVWHVLATTLVDDSAAGQISMVETDLVPFTLRTLKAMEPKYCRKDVTGSLEQHCHLLDFTRTRLQQALRRPSPNAEQVRLWRTRVLELTLKQSMLLCEAKDFAQAIDTLHDLAMHLASTDALPHNDVVDSATRVHLLLLMARVWIQAGSLDGAEKLVDAAAFHMTSTNNTHRQTLENEVAISRGILATMRCDFATASQHFALPHGVTGKQSIQTRSNLALSTFYAGELEPAIETLENLLASDPDTTVNAEPFLFNLTTMLELRSEDVLVDKRRILAVLGQHATHSSGVLTASGLKL